MFFINSVTIENYKVFGAAQSIEFAVPNGTDGSGLTIIVGANNSGKTTLLDALAQCFSNKGFEAPKETRRGQQDIGLGIELIRCPNTPRIGMAPDETNYNLVKQSSASYEIKPKPLPVKLEYIRAARIFKDFLGDNITLRNNSERLNEHNRLNRLSGRQIIDTFVSDVQTKIKSGLASKINKITSYILATQTEIHSDKEASNHILTFKTHGIDHRLKDQGLGVRNVAAISNTLVDDDIVVFLIDEPEVSLHPQAQRRLFNKLWKSSANKQIVIANHSTHFVNWSVLGMSKVYKFVQDEKGDAKINRTNPETVESLNGVIQSDLKNRKLYDTLSKELFFCDTGMVFCEGQEDVHYISNYIENNTEAPAVELLLFGYGAGGASQIEKWLALAAELGVRAVGLYDGDEDENVEAATIKFQEDKSIKVLQIGQPDIRDKYKPNQNGKKAKSSVLEKEGVFKKNGEIKPHLKEGFDTILNEAYEHLKS